MDNRIYGVSRGSDVECDPILVRRMLSSDSHSAKQQLEAIHDLINLEQHIGLDDVDISLDVGVYVRSVTYVDREKVVMTFNNGKTITMSQSDGVYSIGEHVYSMSKSIIGTFDMNLLSYHKAVSLVTSGELLRMSNASWSTLTYNTLPNVRKNCQDDLYNYYDSTSYSSRIQQFKSYLMAGLYEMLVKPSQDQGEIILGCVGFGKRSFALVEDLVVAVNTKLAKSSSTYYKLIQLRFGEVVKGSSIVCYIFDFFVSPALVDLGVLASSKSPIDVTPRFDNVLADYQLYFSDNSSVIVSSYKPIRDIFVDDNGAYELRLDTYDYSQFSYVPHKPWTLINLSTKKGPQFNLSDCSRVSSANRLADRFANDVKTLIINFRRNYRLANPFVRQQMDISYTKVLRILANTLRSLGVNDSLQNWYHDRVMKRPVQCDKTLVHGVDTDVKLALNVMTKVSRMSTGVSYSYKDLQIDGWDTRCLERALYLDLVVPNRSGSINSYFKRDTVDRGIKSYFFDQYVMESPTHSLLDSLGGVIPLDNAQTDGTVTFVDAPLVGEQENYNYKTVAPYPVTTYSDRAVGLGVVSTTPFDHDEFLSDSYSFSAYLAHRKTRIVDCDSTSSSSEPIDSSDDDDIHIVTVPDASGDDAFQSVDSYDDLGDFYYKMDDWDPPEKPPEVDLEHRWIGVSLSALDWGSDEIVGVT